MTPDTPPDIEALRSDINALRLALQAVLKSLPGDQPIQTTSACAEHRRLILALIIGQGTATLALALFLLQTLLP